MTPLELEQCILLASDVGSPKHYEATRVLQAWTVDASTLLALIQITQHESVLFYCLTTFPRCSNVTRQQQTQLWKFLLSHNNNFASSATHVRTKVAVVLAYLLRTAFSTSWATAFEELRQNASPDLYFKTLIALMEDDEFDKCGIKNVMRGYPSNGNTNGNTNDTIAKSLIDTLLMHASQHREDESLLTLALTVLKHFGSWVDVGLLLQEQVMALVFGSLSSSPGVPAMQFLHELVVRGMDDERKLALLQEMDLLQKLHLNVNLDTVDASPIEVVIEVAKLINTTGQELAPMMESSRDNATLSKLWPQVMELFFRCFAYDDIDVSGSVLPLASRITSMQDMPALQLITVMYRQMKYPDDYQYDYEDDDEAEEEVYRSELRKLYPKLVRARPELCLLFLCEALANLPVPLSACPTPELEVALRLVHHYSEGVRPPPGLKTVMKNETFRTLLTALHRSAIVDHPHREVLLLYYDLSVRYYPIFIDQPELLPRLLGALSGERGVQHSHARVRSRSCYLLLRLVKSVIKVMRPYVETAVMGIQGLLTTPSRYQQLRPDDTLYLFETMGLLLGKTGLSPSEQQATLAKVISPHVLMMEETLRSESLARDPDSCGDVLAASIAAIAYLSKGFKSPSAEVQAVLSETVGVNLSVLQALPDNDAVRAKILILLQRLILCLGIQCLPNMSHFLLLLIEHCTTDDIQDVAQLLNQLCIKFGADAIPAMEPALLPFLRKCHELVPSTGEVATSNDIPPHLQTEQLSVKKLTFTVLQHVVTYRLSPVLLSPTNAGSLELVLRTMSEAAIHVQDPVIKKACITFFRELVDQWIGGGGSTDTIQSLFLRFVVETFVPGMLQCMFSPSFNHEDALQARNMSDFATILFLLKARTPGDQFDQYVIRGALTSVGSPPQVLDAFRQVSTQQDMELCLKETIKVLKQAQITTS